DLSLHGIARQVLRRLSTPGCRDEHDEQLRPPTGDDGARAWARMAGGEANRHTERVAERPAKVPVVAPVTVLGAEWPGRTRPLRCAGCTTSSRRTPGSRLVGRATQHRRPCGPRRDGDPT